MDAPRRTDIAIAAATLALGAIVPVLASWHVDRRIERDLEPLLSSVLAEDVRLGQIEAGLLGTLVLQDLRVGELSTLDRVELSMDLTSAFGGRHRVHEIRVLGLEVQDRIERDGSSRFADAVERLRAFARRTHGSDLDGSDLDAGRPASRNAGPLLSSIGGSWSADVAGLGRVRAVDVAWRGRLGEPVMRMRASRLHIEAARGAWSLRGELQRVAVDIDIQTRSLDRVLALGGALAYEHPGTQPLRLEDVQVSSGVPGASEDLSPAALVRIDARVRPFGERGSPGRMTLELGRSDTPLQMRLRGRSLPMGSMAPLVPRSLDVSDAHFSGTASLSIPTPGGAISLEIDGRVDQLMVHDARVARAPVSLSGLLRTRARSWRSSPSPPEGRMRVRHLAVDSLTWEMAGLRLEAQGTAEYERIPFTATDPSGPTAAVSAPRTWIPERASLSLVVPETRCATALQSVPEPFREALVGLDLGGSMGARLALELSRATVDDTRLTLDVDMDRCRVLRDAPGADPRTLVADGSAPPPSERATYVSLRQLPSHVAASFVANEDARFFKHHGFDTSQIERSLAVDLSAGSFVRGGSTITQQLVKNAFLSHERTLARKFQEAILAWRVEAVADKAQILERYLNIIELGPDIRGVAAAARFWFGKEAASLGIRETAFLVALTPAPQTLGRRILATGAIDEDMNARIDKVLTVMRAHDVISEGIYHKALRFELELVSINRS